MKTGNRLRVASLQYWIRPIRSFEEFGEQAEGWVRNAADYKAQLVLFPEYFTVQLLSLGDLRRPLPEQLQDIAGYAAQFDELFATLSKRYQIMVAAGSLPVRGPGGELFNECHLFSPTGARGVQGKVHMTRFEKEDFKISSWSPQKVRVFESEHARVAVAICYDVEFPELVRAAALQGAQLLLVPSCTDDRQGYLRVRYCAQARAVENQIYVVQSSTVGGLPQAPAACLNYGQAALLTPSDYGFARDGILAEGVPGHETMVVGDLDLKWLEESRAQGTVLPLRDSQDAAELQGKVELVRL